MDATCALINYHVNKRGRLSTGLQRRLIERSVDVLEAMPPAVLEQVLAQGSPRRRTLLTRMRRNPMSLSAVA